MESVQVVALAVEPLMRVAVVEWVALVVTLEVGIFAAVFLL